MGTYTRFVFKATLVKDTPVEVVGLLNRVINDRDLGLAEGQVLFHHEDVFVPAIDHDFFKCERWEMLLVSNDWGTTIGSKFYKNGGLWVLQMDTQFKCYDDEIEKFLDWIKPYVNIGRKGKKYLGWGQTESESPRQFHYWKTAEKALLTKI